MHIHRLRTHGVRRALVTAIAGALAAGALAGPAMAAGDDGSSAPDCRKAGEKPTESLTVRKAGAERDVAAHGEPQGSIIAVL
jgi:hypothetical protein